MDISTVSKKTVIKIYIFLFLLLISLSSWTQNLLSVKVRSENKEPLVGATIKFFGLNKETATDSSGSVLLKNLPTGTWEILITYVGYKPQKQHVTIPFNKEFLDIVMERDEEEEENSNVVITTTRTDRSVRNTPTRVEVIAGGEISENVSMRPGEIRMLLNESTGIITQQTSAISSTANLRIQELDGRYTQILRDGFPLYSGLSEGLSLVQIAPLDLKQVEIIKGSSSTLYGGGAIAGLINLVSKTPTDKKEINFLVNGTSTGGLDLSGFYSQRFKNIGLSLFTSRNSSFPYDPAGIGLTAIPKFKRYTLAPHLFLYGATTNLNLGVSYISEDRLGGSMDYIKHNMPGYFESNKSNRLTTQLSITHNLGEHSSFTLKNSFNYFNRTTVIPLYAFNGVQQSSFSELSWNIGKANNLFIIGANLYTDHFKEGKDSTVEKRNYLYNTTGVFIQNTWVAEDWISVETGLRMDHTKPYGFILLPRISLLFKISEKLSSRLGGGLGYKSPSIFTEESEELYFKNIVPLDQHLTEYERSTGINLDFTYKMNMDEVNLTLNPLIFYTRITHPLLLQPILNGNKEFLNASGFTDSKGLDESMRLAYDKWKFYIGYSYTVVQNHFAGITYWYLRSPRNRLHLDLVYEMEGNFRIALESYYTGEQRLMDGNIGRKYWLLGGLIERSWKHLSLFINGEDLNNIRQTKWESIYSGTIDQPNFKDIYTPLEGISVNAGIKIKL